MKCEICGNEFTPTGNRTKTCSVECTERLCVQHLETSNLNVVKVCACGKEFKTKWSESCPSCAYIKRKRAFIIRRRAKNPYFQCITCKNTFKYDPNNKKPVKCKTCLVYTCRVIFHKKCEICKQGFIASRESKEYCDKPECIQAHHRRKTRERNRRYYGRKNGITQDSISQGDFKQTESASPVLHLQEEVR